MAKRRQFTPEFKVRVVLDILTGVQSQAEACRKHGLGPNLLSLWKTAFLGACPRIHVCPGIGPWFP
jgi:transposase